MATEIGELWVRSPLRPEYAICFDPQLEHFGCLLKETGNAFYLERKLTKEDLEKCLKKRELLPFYTIIRLLLNEYENT